MGTGHGKPNPPAGGPKSKIQNKKILGHLNLEIV